MNRSEVLALIDNRAATDPNFATLVAERRDREIAIAISEGRKRFKRGTFIGSGTIVETLGRPGATLLRAMRQAAPLDALVDEGVRLIDAGRWDIGSPATHIALDELVAAQMMPAPAAETLKSLGLESDPIATSVVTDALDNREAAQEAPSTIPANAIVRVLPPFDAAFPGTYRVESSSGEVVQLEGFEGAFAPQFLEIV